MISGLFLLSVFLVIITHRVRKLVWRDDKIMPLMLCFLTACVITQVLFFLYDLVIVYASRPLTQSFNCNIFIFGETPRVLLTVAVLLNTNKWISFLIYILV